MPKSSISFSESLRAYRESESWTSSRSTDSLTNLVLVKPVSSTTGIIVTRIEEERAKSVDEISVFLKENNISDESIRTFRRNIKIITDYYIHGAFVIENQVMYFARRYSCSRARGHQAAISLRIKCVAQAEMLYEEVHLRLGQLGICALEGRCRTSLANSYTSMILSDVQTFAKTIIEQNLTWRAPKGKKYPLCARNFDVNLWPSEPKS